MDAPWEQSRYALGMRHSVGTGARFVAALALCTSAALAGCAHLPEPQVVESSDVGIVYRVRCEDTPDDCIASANNQCRDGARSLRNHSGRRWDTPVYWLEFLCAKPGEDVADNDKPDVGWDSVPAKVACGEAGGGPERG